VDTQNSQKRSPRSSAKSRQETMPLPHESPESYEAPEAEPYLDRSLDHVARVHAAKEAAQRAMESFGDISEYDVTILQGQLKEESIASSQPSLRFDAQEEV
jgi:hypothetical protein